MVVRIRLQRHGRRDHPFYRIGVSNHTKHVTKGVKEYLGTYDPLPDPLGNKNLRLNISRTKYWLSTGAQPSLTVAKLLSKFHLVPQPPIQRIQSADVLLSRALQGKSIHPSNILNNTTGTAIDEYISKAVQGNKSINTEFVYNGNDSPSEEVKAKANALKQRQLAVSPYIPVNKLYRFEPPKKPSATTKLRQIRPISKLPPEFQYKPTETTQNVWNKVHARTKVSLQNSHLPFNPKLVEVQQ